MKGWLVKELGEPQDVLHIEEIELPEIGENEILIKVESASLNFFDILLCQGKYQEKPPLPFTISSEVSGTVVKVNGESNFHQGQRVLALPSLPNGGLVEYVAVKEDAVFPIPYSMSWNEAASMFITYHTSYYSLNERANLRNNDVLLVHAGAGGVGSAAIQLGKAMGAYVIATAGGQEKTNICKELGANVVIDYLTEDFIDVVKEETNGRGADVIFDPVGGDVFERSRKCIAFGGCILVIGFAGGSIPSAPINHILIKNYAVVGVHWGLHSKVNPHKVLEEHNDLMDLYETGKIKPLIYNEYNFEDVPKALKLLAQRKTWGKLVINVDHS